MLHAPLPWLLLNSPWLWKAGLVSWVALAVLALLGARRWFARRWLAGARRALAQTAAPDEVHGVLRRRPVDTSARANAVTGESNELATGRPAIATTLWAERRGLASNRAAVDLTEPGLELVTGDGRTVEIAGPIQVVLGRRTARTSGGVPPALDDAALARAREQLPWLHRRDGEQHQVARAELAQLFDGDEVVMRGVLSRRPAPGETGFRDEHSQWELAPAGDYVAAGARRPKLPRGKALVAAALLTTLGAGLVGYLALGWWGDAQVTDCIRVTRRGEAPELTPTILTNAHPCARAALAPKTRALALEILSTRLESEPRYDEATFRRAVTLARQTKGCGRAVELWFEQQRYEEAGALAHECGLARAEHAALVAQGRYEEAAALPVSAEERLPALPTLTTLVAAGRWRQAADELERRRAALPRAGDASGMLIDVTYRCNAAMFRRWAGDATAAAELRRLGEGPLGQPCDPALVELGGAEGAERLRLSVEARANRPSSTPASHLTEALAMTAGLIRNAIFGIQPEELLAAPSSPVSPSWTALAYLTADVDEPSAPEARSQFLRWRAVGQVFDGEQAAALTSAEQAAALVPVQAPEPRDLPWVANLPALVRLYSPDLDLRVPYSTVVDHDGDNWVTHWKLRFGRLALREGRPLDGLHLSADDTVAAALTAASAGDARPLLTYMRTTELGSYFLADEDLLAVLPRLPKQRAELAALASWRPPLSFRAETSPLATARHAALRRTVLGLAGAERERATWDRIYRRTRAVLADRRRLLALVLIEE